MLINKGQLIFFEPKKQIAATMKSVYYRKTRNKIYGTCIPQ